MLLKLSDLVTNIAEGQIFLWPKIFLRLNYFPLCVNITNMTLTFLSDCSQPFFGCGFLFYLMSIMTEKIQCSKMMMVSLQTPDWLRLGLEQCLALAWAGPGDLTKQL